MSKSKKPETELMGINRLHVYANLIVGFFVPLKVIGSWSLHKRRKAQDYIVNMHLLTNDNAVKKVPRPHWFRKDWVYGTPAQRKKLYQ